MASLTGVTDLFPTPLLVVELPGFEALNAALLPRIVARREADPAGSCHSNQGGWHSDTRMLEWGGAEAQQLARQLGELASRHTRDLGRPAQPRFRWGARMWANVLTPGAANAPMPTRGPAGRLPVLADALCPALSRHGAQGLGCHQSQHHPRRVMPAREAQARSSRLAPAGTRKVAAVESLPPGLRTVSTTFISAVQASGVTFITQ